VIELQKFTKAGNSGGPPQKSEDEQRAFFHAAVDRALAAEAKAGIIERCFALAGFVVSVKFAGDALAQCFVPALAHLEVPPTSCPDAVFHVWDSKSTGTDMLPPPCPQSCFTSRGDIWTMGSSRFKSAYLWSEYALNLFDTVTAIGLYWTQAAEPLPYWAKASPLRCLLHWWAETKGCQLVHSAAVGNEGGAVLITGKGGVGKSTTALSCLGIGLNYLGDDYVVLQLNPFPTVHSLYCTAKLNSDQVARFARFTNLVKDYGPDSEKAVFYLFPAMQGRIAKSLPLQAILTPRISERPRTELGAISTSALRSALAFTTMSQLPHASCNTFRFINRVVEKLPGQELILGSNLDTVADPIVHLLTSSSAEIDRFSHRSDSDMMSTDALISVIIPVHNTAQFLPESVASVLAQKYPAVEIIVVDDGSTDEIADVVHPLPADVRLLKQRRAGLAAARNRGIREASGELIAFLDAGNLWPEGNLRAMADLLSADGSCDVVQGFGRLMKADRSDDVANPVESFPYCPSAAVYRREVFEIVGLFDQESGFGEENDWYDRARDHGLKVRQVAQVTLIRPNDANMAHGKSLRERITLSVLKRELDRERAETRLRPQDSSP
jgi:hypothetical protein